MGAILDRLHVAATSQGWPGIVLLEFMHHDGPVMQCLRRQCTSRRFPLYTKHTWDRGFVTRGGRMESPLSKERKRQIDRKRRALARDLGTEVEFVDRTLDPSIVEEFLVMEAAGWKGKEGGYALAQSPETAAWFREWYPRWAEAGRIAMVCVNAGDTTIAMQCYVRAGDGAFCARTAYDERYAKYGPGAMVIALGTEHLLHHSDAQWIDSLADEGNALMAEMLPERRTMSTVLIGTGGLVDRSFVAALPVMYGLVGAAGDLRDRATSSHERRGRDLNPRTQFPRSTH